MPILEKAMQSPMPIKIYSMQSSQIIVACRKFVRNDRKKQELTLPLSWRMHFTMV